jgi:Flavodoxin domain
MKALVVYESMFGNTEAVARAIADGLRARMEVDLCEVSLAPQQIADPVDLIVVGGPTHAFSLSRPSTRAQALEQGATQGQQGLGLREWLALLRKGPHSELVAAFDTRVDKVRRLPGSAAKKAAKVARALGYAPAGRQSFFVTDTSGPLLPGELERAEAWGQELATEMADRAPVRPVA